MNPSIFYNLSASVDSKSIWSVLYNIRRDMSSQDCTKEFNELFLKLLNDNKSMYIDNKNVQEIIINIVQQHYPAEKWKIFSPYVPIYSDNMEVGEDFQHILNLNLNFCDEIYPSFTFNHNYNEIIPNVVKIFSHMKDFFYIEDFVYVPNNNNKSARYFSFIITTKEENFNTDIVKNALHVFLEEYDSRNYVSNKVQPDKIVKEL